MTFGRRHAGRAAECGSDVVRAGETEDRDRGDAATAGHRLVERFAVAEPPPGVRVWTGVLLSWDVLIDSSALREVLKARYPDAEGGEMEGRRRNHVLDLVAAGAFARLAPTPDDQAV